jgi:hypothetical protein
MDANFSFIPIAIRAFGEIGSTFLRFWDGTDPMALPNFPEDRPQAKRATLRAISANTPYDIIGRTDKLWRLERGNTPFDGSFLSPSPSIWANQQLGLVCCTSLSNHINTSFNHLRFKANATDEEGEDEIDWNWVDLDYMKEDTRSNTASAPVDGPSGHRGYNLKKL